MKDVLYDLLMTSHTLSFQQVLIQTLAASVTGAVIFFSYWITHTGTVYSKKFNVSLIMLTILTSTVMAVIANNVALSLGMVGALSIVRYRTAIKDSRDTAYLFWAVIAGICCGAGDFLVVGIGSLAVFIILLFLGRIRSDNRMLLIIRCSRDKEREVETFIYQNVGKRIQLRVKNSSEDSLELIYEITRQVYDKANQNGRSVLDRLYEIGSIEYVNLAAQNDEIV